jgi:hypothetical protein
MIRTAQTAEMFEQGLTIDHDAEALACLPHDLGCLEWYAEIIVERAAEAGIEMMGRHDERYEGVAIVDRFHLDMVTGEAECHCDRPAEYEDEQ